MENIIRLDLGGVNAYLIENNGNYLLVDVGGYIVMDKVFSDRYDILQKKLDENGVTADNLKLIVLTHGDIDHVCNADRLRKKYGVKIAMHEADKGLVENLTVEAFMKSFNYSSPMFKLVFALMKKTIKKVAKKTVREFKGFSPDITLCEGDNLDSYGFNVRIMETPGHTNGSITLITSGNEAVAGDLMANNGKPAPAPNALDFKVLKASVEKLINLKPKKIYPGHGEPFSVG